MAVIGSYFLLTSFVPLLASCDVDESEALAERKRLYGS
jgi:hypothetical protein